jgi:exportin-2 (importin alpha re-exporter)
MDALTNSDVMRPYTNQVLLLLLNRLQSKPSALFTQAFVYFMTLLSAVESVGPDFVIQSLDAIQPGYVCLLWESEMLTSRLFGNILNGVVLSNTQKVSVKDRKVVEVGLTRFLAKSDIMISDSHRQLW